MITRGVPPPNLLWRKTFDCGCQAKLQDMNLAKGPLDYSIQSSMELIERCDSHYDLPNMFLHRRGTFYQWEWEDRREKDEKGEDVKGISIQPLPAHLWAKMNLEEANGK